MDEKQIQDIILNTPADQLAKAVKDAKGLEGIRIIKDLWEDEHQLQVPPVSDTKTGPSMHSSGAGAEHALKEYSNTAPQIGLVEVYDQFTRQNVENFGKVADAMKSFGEKIETGFGALTDLLVKSEDKKEKEDDEKAMKSDSFSAKLASYWDKLGEVEEAFAKAEDESKDIENIQAARDCIEKAEKHLEEAEAHEKEEEKEHKAMKAMFSINLAWRSLSKATALDAHGLHGTGNQKDEQVAGDEAKDHSDFKGTSKARYMAAKADALKKAKKKEKKEEKKSMYCAKFDAGEAEKLVSAFEHFTKAGLGEHDPAGILTHSKIRKALGKYASKLASVVSPTPSVTATPATASLVPNTPNAEVEKAKADMAAELQKAEKAFNERIQLLNQRMEAVTGQKAPAMVPVLLKSGGIKSDNIAENLNTKIEASMESGALTEENAGIARTLVSRYQAAGKGYIAVNIVNQQLDRAPVQVQQFFKEIEANI